MSKLGRWLNKPHVELEDDDRKIKLLEPLRFSDPNERCWVAPTNTVADGASIPRLFWSFIGGPLDGKYRNASIIHDFYCSTRTRPWEKVHDAFFDGMMASHVYFATAKVMYAAVRYFGPRWTEMDSENIRVLRAQGIKDIHEVKRVIAVEFEDCTGPSLTRRKGVHPYEKGSTYQNIEQSQVIYYLDHQDAQADVNWVFDSFNNSDRVDLADIDAAIEKRHSEFSKSEVIQQYFSAS